MAVAGPLIDYFAFILGRAHLAFYLIRKKENSNDPGQDDSAPKQTLHQRARLCYLFRFRFGPNFVHRCSTVELIPSRQPVAAAWIGGAEPDAGFFLNHYSLRVAHVTRPGGKFVPSLCECLLGVP